jgi:hypothetical protein
MFMTSVERSPDFTVLGRLKATPILIWIAAILILAIAAILKGKFESSLYYHIFGDLLVPIFLVCVAVGLASFMQMFRWRDAYLRHDSNTLYRGGRNRWPISNVDEVYIATNWLGIRSLRARIGARDIELFKAYFAVEDADEVLDKLKLLARL